MQPTEAHGASTAPTAFHGTPYGAAWANLTNESAVFPSARSVIPEQFAYDPVDAYFVEFGGLTLTAYVVNDTWTFESGRWTQLNLTVAPPPLDHASMAWDAKDGYLVLFGGATSGFAGLNETWKFLHGQWTQLHPSRAPSPRWGASMAWDPAADALVLFGGCANHVEQNDTWTFVGGNWANVTVPHSPAPREDASIAFDSSAGYLTVFGGQNPDVIPNVAFNDTWQFSAGIWTNISSSHSPSPRFGAGMVYFATVGGLLLYGGSSISSSISNQTWYLRGGVWAEQPTPRGLPAEAMGGFAAGLPYTLFLFGGEKTAVTAVNATWEYYALNLTVVPDSVLGDAPSDLSFGSSALGGRSPIITDWSFGDGGNASGANVSHIYRDAGNYTVSVHAADRLGVASNLNFTVRVLPQLLVSASAGPLEGAAPLSVTYTTSVEGGEPPYSYFWSLGNAVPIGPLFDGPTLTYNYTTPGIYTTELVVSDSLAAVVDRNFTITVNPSIPPSPPLTLSFSANRTEGEAPFAVQFNASAAGGMSPYSLKWAFGDGSASTLLAPTNNYSSPGRYVVGLTATDAAGTHATAPNVTVVVLTHVTLAAGVNVRSGHDPFVEDFMASPSDGLPPYTLVWTYGDGSTGSGASTSHTYASSGSYNVSVEVVDALGDAAQSSIPVSIASAPSSVSPTWYATSTTWEIVGGALGGLVIGVAVTWLFGRRGSRRLTKPGAGSGR